MTDPNISTHWYKGNITRDQAVDYLKQTQLSDIAPNFADQNVFLVRWSPKFEKPNTDKPKYSQYVLSVRFNDETLKHYRIFYHNRPLPGYEEHQVGFYIETSTNHSSGFDYIGNPDILCENLENGKIELEKSSVVNDINGNVSIERKPYKCFPILNNNYDTPNADEPKQDQYFQTPQPAPRTNRPTTTTVITSKPLEQVKGFLNFKEDNLLSKLNKDGKRWYYKITDRQLLRYTVNPEWNNNKEPTGSLDFKDVLEVVTSKDNKFILKIANRHPQKYTVTDTNDNFVHVKEERDKWVLAIRQRLRMNQVGGKINP